VLGRAQHAEAAVAGVHRSVGEEHLSIIIIVIIIIVIIIIMIVIIIIVTIVTISSPVSGGRGRG
jgi:hypothetical protein